MSSRFNDRKKKYSRSRSKSWSRDHHRMDRENQRRPRDQYKHKSRYDQRKNLKDNFKQCHVSIDWKPKSNSEKYKHHSKYSRSHSVSSSSSSSSSSYSSSGSKSRKHKGQKKERDYWRRKSSQKNRDRDRKKSLSRSESKNNSKKQLDEKHRDTEFKKYQKREKDKKFQSHYQSHKNQQLNKHYMGGNKAFQHTKTFQKPYQNIGNQNKLKNDDEKKRENQNRRKIETKKQVTKMQNVDTNSQKKKEYQNEKRNIEIDMGKKKIQEILKQDNQHSVNNFIQTIKKVQNHQAILDAEKQRVSKVTELINESKRNLEITPMKTNFLILDSFRSLKKFNAQTLDPALFCWLQKDFQLYYEQEKSKVFAKETIIGEERQNARICLPSHPSEQLIELTSQLQMLRGSMLNLNHMFRQLHIIQ